MLIKLKPNQPQTELITKNLKKSNIRLIWNDNFFEMLNSCSGCILEPSSLGIIPALMGVPILLANFGILKNLKFVKF